MQRALLCGLFAALVPCLGFGANEVSSSTYHIVVIGGQTAMHNTRGSIAQGPVVEVKDQNNHPVKGAYVTFKSPSSGPSLAFSNGSTQFSATTGDSGRAAADGLRANSQPGDFIVLVKASYHGQSIGPVAVKEVNVSGGAVELSRNLSADTPAPANIGNMAGAVLGIATAPDFKLNGTVVPDNANLLGGNEVASLDKTVTIDLKDGCDYLLAPNSLVKILDHKLILENGKVRARHVGTCQLGAGKWTVSGNGPQADGVVAYSNDSLQVASLNGTLNVTGAPGMQSGTVNAGGSSTYGGGTPGAGTGPGQTGGASGASAGGPPPAATTGASSGATGPKLIYAGALGTALGGLGLAVDAILQPGSPTPTSP